MPDELRIMIAAGGTGGHVFPAIAIADAIRDEFPKARFLFVGTRDRMEWKAVPAAGYDISPIWISGLHRRITLKNLLFPLKLIVSLWQSYRLMRKFQPDVLVSCGGFVAGPAGWVASWLSVPLFLQEQNSYPGMTNRKLAGRAERIFTAFENANQWFPNEKTVCVGNPVRKNLVSSSSDPVFVKQSAEHFGLDTNRPVLLVMGGSGGAKSINEAMLRHLRSLHDTDRVQIIWQCGNTYLEDVTSGLTDTGKTDTVRDRFPDLRLYGFMENITEAWAIADLVVSRAGATTCAELLATGKAGILVPSPWVAGDHQTQNAIALAQKGAAVLLKDEELAEKMLDVIRALFKDTSRRRKIEREARNMAKANAALVIARDILSHMQKNEMAFSWTGRTAGFISRPTWRLHDHETAESQNHGVFWSI
ncbi:MAG: undecaprenyldiphospho-muramoylpentapeptide beta-N-acetylglucosaminyltransferase [Balneolales bacterium]